MDIINKKIVTLDNLEKHTENIVKEVKTYVTHKTTEVKTLVEQEVLKDGGALSTEIKDREAADKELNQTIQDEVVRATSRENEIQNLLIAEQNERAAADNTEIQNRTAAIDTLRTQLRSEMSSSHSTINSTISIGDAQVTTAFQTADANLKDKIDTEITDRKTAINDITELLKTETARREVGDKVLQEQLDQHLIGYDAVESKLTAHIAKIDNPHNVTPDQIGAVSTIEHLELDARVGNLESKQVENESLKTDVQELQSDVEFLITDKLSSTGNAQSLTGDLTITKSDEASGNLTVEGNLVVKGITKTVQHETVEVSDNLIVVNSDGIDLAGANSGIAIKTNKTNSYGIVYNPVSNSVNLGNGVLDSDGNFVFTNEENNPILTRSEDSKLTNGHLLIWDSESKKAIDGGEVPNLENVSKFFVSKETHQELGTQVELNKLKIELAQKDIEDIQEDLNTKVDLVPTNDDGTNQLKTISNNIPGAINENKNSIDSHIASTNNPHHITIEQIGAEKAFSKNTAFNKNFSDTNPSMNGATGSPGISEQISRSDHVHPHDISRAPKKHTDTVGEYGKATFSEYGHVIVDNAISDVSENPIQNKIIKTYVDNNFVAKMTGTTDNGETRGFVYGLKSDGTTPDLYKLQILATAGTIPFRNPSGTFYVGDATLPYEAVNKSYVDDLVTSTKNEINDTTDSKINKVQPSIDNIQSNLTLEIQRATEAEATLQNTIDTEIINRKNADTALATQLDTRITNVKNDLEAAYDPVRDFVRELLTLDNNKKYVASWKEIDGIATPYWTSLDEGELS